MSDDRQLWERMRRVQLQLAQTARKAIALHRTDGWYVAGIVVARMLRRIGMRDVTPSVPPRADADG